MTVELKELLTQRMDLVQKATDISIEETHRRLEILNGEAERLRLMQSTYLPREVYQQNYTELSKAIQELEKKVAMNQGRDQTIAIFVSVSVSTIISLTSILLPLLLK